MKELYIFLILSSVFFSCQIGEKNIKESGLILKATYKGEYYSLFYDSTKCYSCRTVYYLVDIKLINNSDSQFEFWTLGCCPSRNIVVDTKEVINGINFCMSDSHIGIELKPKQEFTMPIILQAYKRIDKEIKIGYIFLNSKNVPFEQFFSKLNESIEKLENVIWSEPISFGFHNEQPFEVKEKSLENLSPF